MTTKVEKLPRLEPPRKISDIKTLSGPFTLGGSIMSESIPDKPAQETISEMKKLSIKDPFGEEINSE